MSAAVDRARRLVDKLADAERQAALERITKARELDEIRSSSGSVVLDAMLAGSNGQSVGAGRAKAKAIVELREEIDLLDRTIDAARERRLEAIPGIWRAEAAEVRQQAAQLRQQADELAAKAQVHLDALQELAEGSRFLDEAAAAERFLQMLGPGNTAHSDPISVSRRPRWVLLRLEADQLERQATALEARQVSQDGEVEADSLEQLVDLVIADPLRLAPPFGELLDWASTAEVLERDRRRRLAERRQSSEGSGPPEPGDPPGMLVRLITEPIPLESPVRWRCVWRAGQLERGASRVESPAADAEVDPDNRRLGLVSRRVLVPVPQAPELSLEERRAAYPHAWVDGNPPLADELEAAAKQAGS